MRQALGLCAVIGLVAACGGSSTGGGPDAAAPDAVAAVDATPDATPTVTEDDICGTGGAYAQLVGKIVSCNPGIDVILLQGQATPAAISAFCHGSTDPYLPATVGLPTYAQLQACLAYINSTSCLDMDFNAPACDLFHGKVADTMGCDSTEQCLDASYCSRPNGNTCGTCTPREIDGTACTVDEQCANGKCVGVQCGHPGLDGDPCVITNGQSDDCLGQRRCNPQSHQCETKNWQLNDTCTGFGDCGILNTDLWCKPTNGTSGAGQCAHFVAIGSACTPGTPGAGMCDLRSYDWCNPNAGGGAKCSPPNIVQDGHTCGLFPGDKCATGLVCSDPFGGASNPGRCYTPGPKDAACGVTGDAPCGLFLGCTSNQCEYTDVTPACP